MAARSIAFFLLPVYTRIFSVAEYGTIEMLSVLVTFLSITLQMGMDSAQSFYFFAEKEKQGSTKRKELVSSILQWRLISGVIIIGSITAFVPLLNSVFFENALHFSHFAFAFSSALFLTVMTQSFEIFRLLFRPWPYVLFSLAYAGLSATLILIFVLFWDSGTLGYFAGNSIASLLIGLSCWFSIRGFVDLSQLHFRWWPRLLKFGLPLIPAEFAFYFLSTMDRWFIQQYQGAFALGQFAVAAKIAMIVAVLVDVFRKAWWPIAMDAMQSEDGPETFRQIATVYNGLGIAFLILFALGAEFLASYLVASAFSEVVPLTRILIWPALFYGFYLIGSAGIWKMERTYLSIYFVGGAVLLGILLNYLLVPQYGAMGAGVATAITYFVWIVVTMIVSETLWRVQFQIWRMLLQLIVGVVMTMLITFRYIDFSISGIVISVICSIGLCLSILDKSLIQQLKTSGILRKRL